MKRRIQEATGSDTRHRIPYKCPINVPSPLTGLRGPSGINAASVNFIHHSDVYEVSFVSFVCVLNDGDPRCSAVAIYDLWRHLFPPAVVRSRGRYSVVTRVTRVSTKMYVVAGREFRTIFASFSERLRNIHSEEISFTRRGSWDFSRWKSSARSSFRSDKLVVYFPMKFLRRTCRIKFRRGSNRPPI